MGDSYDDYCDRIDTPEYDPSARHISTVQQDPFVWHLFDLNPRQEPTR